MTKLSSSIHLLVFTLILLVFGACLDKEKIESVLKDPPRKELPRSKLGINAFFNDSRFGTIKNQADDVTKNLKFKKIRVLLRWDDKSHPSPKVSPNFTFLDSILREISKNVDIILVTTGLPSWMSDRKNWIQDNPRVSFITYWLDPLLEYVKRAPLIKAVQVWNEPNDKSLTENAVMGFKSPSNYYELLAYSRDLFNSKRVNKALVNAATTAINQNSNNALEYNKDLISLGAHRLVDKWAVHIYGSQFEKFFVKGGIKDVLSRVRKPILVTESGARGINKQLEYGERVWPFLVENLRNLEVIYIYTYTEDAPPDGTYGLRNLSKFPFSDLYLKLLN